MCKNKVELTNQVNKVRKLMAEKKKLEAQIKDIKEDITEYVLAKGVLGGKNNTSRIVYGDDFKVSYLTTVEHPLDTDKVKDFLGDRLPEFQTEKISNKLDIR